MSYVEKNVLPNEEVSGWASVHWLVFIPPILWFIFGHLFFPQGYIWIYWTMGAFFVFDCFVKYFCTEFAVTNKRVIAKHGFIMRKTIEINLPKVESMGVDQSILGRIFNYGDIKVSGTGGVHAQFKFIASPLKIRSALNEELEKLVEKK